jgi:hypothetical protein
LFLTFLSQIIFFTGLAILPLHWQSYGQWLSEINFGWFPGYPQQHRRCFCVEWKWKNLLFQRLVFRFAHETKSYLKTPCVLCLQITSSTDLTRQQNLPSNPPTPRQLPIGKAFLTLWTQPCSTQTDTPTSSKQGNTTDLTTGPLQ